MRKQRTRGNFVILFQIRRTLSRSRRCRLYAKPRRRRILSDILSLISFTPLHYPAHHHSSSSPSPHLLCTSKLSSSSVKPKFVSVSSNLSHSMKLQNRRLQQVQEGEEEAPVSTSSSKSSQPSINLRYFQLPLSPSTNGSIAPRTSKPMSSIDSSMALTLLFLFTVILFLGFFSIYVPCFSRQSSDEISRRRRRQQRASSNVRSLPVFVYNGNNSEEVKERMDCAICLTEFEEKETVRMIPYCGHLFHQQCIDAWFYSKVSCPLCRSTQLFRLSSAKKKEASSLSELEEGRLDDHESMVRSTVGREDTWREGQVAGVRRTSSCSSLTERVLLPRSSSF